MHPLVRTGDGQEPRKYCVGALGTYGGGNLGDEAVFVSFLNWARRCRPPVRPVALCANPQYIRRTYAVEAFGITRVHTRPPKKSSSVPNPHTSHSREPCDGVSRWRSLRRNLPRPPWVGRLRKHFGDAADLIAYFQTQLRVTGSLDAVVVLGGGQIHDFWGGPLSHPGTLFLWALACKLRRKPFIVMSVGGVHLRHPLSRWLIRRMLEWSQYVSCRDADTANIVRAIGVHRPCKLAPDLAWALMTDDLIQARSPRHLNKPACSVNGPSVVGLSPMVYGHPTMWPEGNAAEYANYVAKLAGFCARLTAQGYEVVLFATQVRADKAAIDDVLACLAPELRARIQVQWITGISELLRCLARLDIVVASRFHGILLSLLTERPALSLSYQKKNDYILGEVGERRFALDIHRFSLEELNEAFDALCAHYDVYRKRLHAHAHRQRERVAAQYNGVFAERTWRAEDRAKGDGAALLR
jgi:polysaccharide pyruvyl transferase WcaK-like protein